MVGCFKVGRPLGGRYWNFEAESDSGETVGPGLSSRVWPPMISAIREACYSESAFWPAFGCLSKSSPFWWRLIPPLYIFWLSSWSWEESKPTETTFFFGFFKATGLD